MSVGTTPFRRINPHPGMMIDADVWRDAHNYHREQLGLHHLALHGWGIVEGLEVSVVESANNTLRIEAGYAIDPAGRFIIVPRSQTYQVTAEQKQQIFLVLQFRDVLAEPVGSMPTRVIEAYRIQERDRLPEEPYVELGRFDFDPRSGTVKPAKDGANPARNELDLRSRPHVGRLSSGSSHAPSELNGTVTSDGLAPRLETLSEQLGRVAHQVEVLTSEVEAARQSAPTGNAPAGGGPTDERSPGSLAPDAMSEARLDSLTAEVQELARRLETLANRPQSDERHAHSSERHGSDQNTDPAQDDSREGGSQNRGQGDTAQDHGQKESDAREVATAPPSMGLEQMTAIVADQVSMILAEQVLAITQRVDAAARQGDALAGQLSTAQQREETDVQGLGARVEDLRREVDSLGFQLQALSHQVETLPTPQATPIAYPSPFEPEPTRPQTTTTTPADRAVVRLAPAEHSGAGWDAHREGLRFLARELSAMNSVSGQVVDPVRVRNAGDIELLYISGQSALSLDDGEVEAIGRLLNEGAVVVGEGCATGPSGEAGAREFAMSFVDLANRLGRQLTRLDRTHPLMTARHVFGELPSGARAAARVLESGGIVYSDADYGCAWQGGTADRPLSRGVIRDALDFGLNLALFRRNDART